MKICLRCSELYPEDASFCPLDGSELAKSADPLLGRTVAARYRLIKKIGAGGMSTVYLARHVMIDRLNAIKVLRQDLSLDPSHRERFIREARAVNRINHPNIIEITDFGELDGLAYLVMEYADADSLLTHLRVGAFAWDRAADVGVQISSALARAHQAGVIHRDLKPENILLLSAEGGRHRVKLTDFGIAKIIDAPALTFSEQMFGTPGYIAPEVVEGAPLDGRADIYALGVVIYEMITGKLPYDGKSQAELLLRPLNMPPIPLARRGVEVPADLEALILGMLSRKPDDRPHDAFIVHDTLQRILQDARGGAIPVSSAGPVVRDSQPTLADDPPDSEVGVIEGNVTADIGRLQTSEMASRWTQALAEIDAAIERAEKKKKDPALLARAIDLSRHAHSLSEHLDRAMATVAELQARVDRQVSHARDFRSRFGRAIDELVHDMSRERARRSALQASVADIEDEGPRSDARVWETATLLTEEDRTRTVVEDLDFQIHELEAQLLSHNERFDKDHNAATGELEGAISAVRAMTTELVRTLDEAASLLSLARRIR